MSARTIFLIVAVVGLLFAIFSGTGHLYGVLSPTFGTRQVLGVVGGVVVCGVAMLLYLRRRD
jgi:hypothetical protein